MTSRCLSSHLMTELLAWRNPQEREENWINSREDIYDRKEHYQKVITAEVGLVLLTLTSTIETIAYITLAVASQALRPITNQPYHFFAQLLQSSSFTILWGTADTLLYNPFFVNVMTHESFARYWADLVNPTSIELYRFDDRLYVSDWEYEHRQAEWAQHIDDAMLGPIRAEGRDIQLQIEQGANFIKQDVLLNASQETLDLFNEMDASIFLFILTKSVYIYAAGSNKKEKIPGFFKKDTIKLIEDFRKEPCTQETLQQVEPLLANPEQFETIPKDNTVKSVFTKLRNIASTELQDSLFVTRCYSRALELLSMTP